MNVRLAVNERPHITHLVSAPGGRHSRRVESTDLTQSQSNALRRQISQHLRYLRRLKDRMGALAFPLNDLLYVATARAVEACEQLHRQADIRAGTYRRRAGKSRGT